MKPLRIEATNFMTYEALDLSLDRSGVFLIVGDNKDEPQNDSNGSGKSAILEAISVALFGQSIRDEKLDVLVHRNHGKNCVVTFTFEEGGATYKAIRHIKDKNHFKESDLEFFRDGVSLTSNSIAETQAKIVSTIGYDFTTFRAFMPGAGITPASLTDKGIKELLENILQVEPLQQAQKLARERKSKLDMEWNQVSASLAVCESKKASLEASIRDLENKRVSFERNQLERVTSLEGQCAQAENELLSVTKQLRASDQAKVKSEESQAKAQEAKKELDSIVENIRSIEAEYFHKEQDLNATRYELEATKKLLLKEFAALKNLGPTCTSCKQSIPHSHVEDQTFDLRKRFGGVETGLAVNEQAVQLHKEALQKELAPLKEKERFLYDTLTKYEVEVKKCLAAYDSTLSFKQQSLTKDVERLKAAIKSAAEETYDSSDLIKRYSQELEEVVTSLKEYQEKKAKLEEQSKALEFWVDGFSTKGVRSYMLKHVTPILNEFVKKYTDCLTDGAMTIRFETEKELKNGSTKEDFSIIVDHRSGGKTYKASSGGEKARADLAIALTLGDLASLRSDKKIPFRFIDEAFEKVDEAGMDAIVKLLQDQERAHDTVFVVTHNANLKQHFTNVITVTKENGVSTIHE